MFEALFYNQAGKIIGRLVTDNWTVVQTRAKVLGAVRVEVAIAYT